MNRYPDDDLFRDTTMSFGEHLEELRKCLFRAIFWLALGFVGGLTVGSSVVRMIETPLRSSLEDYYTENALIELRTLIAERTEVGESVPYTAEQIEEFVERERLLFEYVYVDPAIVLREIEAAYPGAINPDALPGGDDPPSTDDAASEAISSELETESPEVASEPPRQEKLARIMIWRPLENDIRTRIKALNVHEPFMIYLKASLIAGALFSSPLVFREIWGFVAAGLYPHEKRYVNIFLPFSVGLFVLGFGFAFLLVLEPVLDFLLGFNRWMNIDPDPRISEWLSFVLFLPLGFGISFQLPLVMLFLERIGVFTAAAYLEKWRISILVISVISMLLTPADPYSMMLMAAPLTALYFLGILLCKYMPKRKSPIAEEMLV